MKVKRLFDHLPKEVAKKHLLGSTHKGKNFISQQYRAKWEKKIIGNKKADGPNGGQKNNVTGKAYERNNTEQGRTYMNNSTGTTHRGI